MKKNWTWIYCLITVLLILGTTQISFAKDAVRVYFFYSEESGGQTVNDKFIKPLSKKYPLEIQSFSLSKLENYDLHGKFEKELKQEDNELLVVIIGDKILGGEAKIRKDLEGLVKSYAEKGGVAWPSLAVKAAETELRIPHAPTEEEKRSKKIMVPFSFCEGVLTAKGRRLN